MPSLSLKIILEDGAVTRVMKFPSGATVADATQLVQEKLHTGGAGKDYGLFLTSADDDLSGIWLEDPRHLDYYLLKDGDSLHYRCRVRTLRIRMLDGSVKTMQVDESKPVEYLMMTVCGKLGITNHEEYGFCREDEAMEAQPSTGTLTLKRKPLREKDAAMQQLSKKLKTDDNVEWLEQHKTLRESSVAPTETLLLKRRLFYSDRKVDARDPVQLNLLFVQARDAVLEGRHPVTEAQAMEFAGIQCQVQYGDYQEDKHKPGFIENLSEFLPQQYSSSWGAEKKVLKEHSKHTGLSQIDAKYLYTKTVRDLPTYGVTFFLVKEIQQKGKKKLVPRLLGISANSVLRLDETTKEVLQVWPLTQVKTYKASKGEMFTLNFGDYSDKEYCVKTNDAYRIRDILQGYIDLIRKKMAGPSNPQGSEGGIIYSATVESSKGNFMEVVSHSANKVVETSFVGPTKIVTYAQGSNAKVHGTQIMTAQEVIITSQPHNKQSAMAGGVAMRSEISTDTVKKLNELNGNAVKIVKLLTDPNETSIEEARKIAADIQRDMPILVEGVKQCIEKQPDEAAKKKLTMELKELCDSVEQLNNFRNPSEAQEAAMRIADLTTQMYFALDPRQKRRSDYIRRSRKSFIDDERTQATLQRASFINTVAAASQAIDDARGILNEKYEGRALTPSEVEALERSGRDKLAKLNAAIALFAAAHADPKNIDYAAAVNSMNTIKKLMPELAKDAQALSYVQDGQDRRGLLQDMRDLCDAASRICQNTGCDDLQKMHDEADNYAKKAGRLIFTFGRVHPDKEKEIIELAKAADDKASLLLGTVSKLSSEVDDPGAAEVRQAIAKCGHAARGLRACAQLTAPSLHEPHCRSALSAASGDLSSSAQLLTNACRPLLDHPKGQSHSEAVKHHSAELAKALERLNNAFADLDGTEDGTPSAAERERRRLQFVTTLSQAQDALDSCDKILKDNAPASHTGGWLGDTLPARLAELNAAVAALLAATRDGENPDYARADAAMATIQHHMPSVVKDCKWYSRSLPEGKREELLGDLKALCDAMRALALNTRHGEDANDSVAEFARSTGKLTYVFDRRARPENENQIIDLAKSSCEKTSELLAHVYGLAAEVGGAAGDALDARGTRVADAAQELLITAQLTAPTIHAVPCKRALIQSAKSLSSDLDRLAKVWPAACQPHFAAQGEQLDAQRKLTEAEIQKLLAALNELPDHYVEPSEDPSKKKKRVQFTFSLSQAQDAVKKAEMEIEKPVSSKPLTPAQAKETQRSLADKLASLNAAIAALMTATQDPYNPNYEAAGTATATIQKLIPELVQETKSLSSGKSETEKRGLLEELRALCDATKAISASAAEGNSLELDDAMARYANAARRLNFVCTPAQAQNKHQDVIEKTRALCDKSSEVLSAACQLGEAGQGAGETGRASAELRARGVARAARALLATAQLTASSLHSTQCRSALHQAASDLSQAVAQLDQACRPKAGQEDARLKGLRREFDDAVAELMLTIKGLEGATPAILSPEQEKRRLKFVTTRSAAQAALGDAARELAKPVTASPLTPPQANALQSSLSDRLATLNAAIAALLAATRDPEKPNYAAAESATATIQELMPDLVKDAKILNIGKKDKSAQSSLLESLRALCDATNCMIGAALPSDNVQNGKEQDLNDAVAKFTDASGKLVYTFNPHSDSAKEDQIIDLTKSTCQKTSELLAQVNDLAEQVGGEQAEDLDTRGAKVADAAQNLLTTAEITAPSITSPLCQSSLLTSADALSSSVEQLALAWHPVTSHGTRSQELELAKKQLDEEIAKLREAVKSGFSGEKSQLKKERLRFKTSLASTEAALKNAEKELNEPCGVSLPATAAVTLQDSLANRLAALNAAINSLIVATRDHNNPDYAAAETATAAIRELMPDILKDTKTLSSSKDAASRDELLAQIRALCEATRRLGAGAERSSPEDLNEAATQISLASGKLNFVFNPRADQKKTHEIMDTCKTACIKTSEMLQHVHALAAQAPEGAALDERGAGVSDAARALLTTAQLTAHTAHSVPCQAALLSAADNLSATVQDLQATWTPVVKDPRFKSTGEQLGSDKLAVDSAIENIKDLVKDGKGKKAPAVPVRTGSLKVRAAAAGKKSSTLLATKEFLDVMCSEASTDASHMEVKSPTSIARGEEEKRAKLQFNKSVDDARQSIITAEKNLMTYLKADSKPRASLDDAQICALNKQMEHKLARANAAAAHLLACRGGDKPDYKLASKCVSAVSDLMPTIVTDAKTLGDLKDEKGRKVFLEDTLGLCTASKNLCDTAKTDKKKLTEAALSFGNQSSKLLYAVSTDIDPSQENEVLLRVKAVGDVACRVTEGSSEPHVAQRCASQATVFMYTAKLIAPSIQDPECQDSLITASKDLTTQLKNINKPELAAELATLEQLLEALRSDVASGKFVKRREKLVVEDTPLRRLTAKVIEDAKQNAEDTGRPAEERRAMADFANKLTDALKMLDLANARCKNTPHDLRKRAELEAAVLSVQQLVLQLRPRRAGASRGNIVDLADYLKDVSTAAEQLVQVASSPAMSSGAPARAAGAVAAQCHELCACVARATAPAPGTPPTDADHAAKESISRVQKINTAIECCPEGPEKNVLKKEARPLNESCTLLNFANQAALATAQCAALDEALDDLSELEHRIDRMLQPKEGERRVLAQSPSPSPSLLRSRARLATAAAGAARGAQDLAPAFVRYVADMRAHVDVADDKKRMRLADHLKRLHDRLKLLSMETGRQVATWKDDRSEVAAITDDILKELDNAEAVIGAKPESTKSLIAHEDFKKLLLPLDSYKVEGDKKQLEAKLESSATKLNSMTETLMLSIGKPESLARSAHVTAESAVQLAAIARATKSDEDPTKHSRIDEASQELCFVTYNLLKTAESASHDPNSFKSRRRLLDACRSLTEAINKLTRTASCADKLQRECNELSRTLQLRQSSLQARPNCSLSYAECISALQMQHAAIENLKSDKPMSRDEFCTSLDLIASAVTNNVEYAEQCAYLLSISEQHPELAKEGMFDAARVQKLIAATQDCCFRVTRSGIVHQAKEESSLLSKQLSDLKQAIQECSGKVTDPGVRKQLVDASGKVDAAGMKLQALLNMEGVSVDKLTPPAFTVLEALSSLQAMAEHPTLAPLAAPSPPAKQRGDDVLNQTKELLTRATALMRVVKTTESQEAMTWVMFNTYTKGVVEGSDQLVTCVRNNGQNAGFIEGGIEIEEDADMTTKSYVQTQVLIANKWLHKPTFKAQIKADGETAARNVIEIGKKMTKHLKDTELEEMRHLSEECEQLLGQCSAKYDLEAGSVLMDRLKDLAKAIDRCVVTMVVEDLIEDQEPMADLETFIDAEKDETKRKYVLERKIADLLAHLGRVTKTARVVADGHGHGDGAQELRKCTDQASLLAPKLVKAAEQRVIHPTEKAVVEEYRTQLAQYSESLSRVRDLCDRAVDPMQFVQTAEETMQRMKEESTGHQNDMQKCSNTSTAIRKLANRVINVSMSSKNAQRDPELMKALSAAQQRLKDAEPAKHLRASKMPDWRNNIAEILRATGEVESVLGGEMIFQKLPEPDRPIYNAARNLHAAVREWSARDNEIVAVAKRMAVLMAKLSDHMHSDRKRDVISTSKAIVAASHEVAQLARKLALECTDMRIRTNLLQVCDQIPLISGQLKMLTTVKGSSLGHQGTEEDIEAMNMLVGNAQNLMTSIQDIVKAAAGASVKIRSQRGGPRMRWVRKNYQ